MDVINTLLHSVYLTQFPVIVLYMHNVTAPHVHMSDKACFYGIRDQLPLFPHPSISLVYVFVMSQISFQGLTTSCIEDVHSVSTFIS